MKRGEIIEKLIEHLKGRYPNVHKVLIQDRNEFMAKHLIVLMKNHPDQNIVAVIGAGHKKGILELIKKEFE